MTLTAGTKLGRYEIRSVIGVGGMGEVYRANDPNIARDGEIKVLPADLSADEDREAGFEQEAQAAGVTDRHLDIEEIAITPPSQKSWDEAVQS